MAECDSEATVGLNEALGNVPGEKLDQVCSNDDLNTISRSLTHWAEVSPWLGLTEVDEEEIRASNDRVVAGLQRERINVLRKWKEMQGDKATYRSLIEAFFGAQRLDLVDVVIECLHTPATSQATLPPFHSAPPPQPFPLAEYGQFLRKLYMYEADTPAASVQWPPLPVQKAFNLAMIRPDAKVQSGKVLDEYVRLTVTGKVDDILHKKTPVKLEDIFKLDDKTRKLILIEGAPGSGKSTLSWDICKRWGTGELFQEYDAVILVQLRDPKVQAATTLADILPAKEKAMAERVAMETLACEGQKLLFILDGWDELPSSLQNESLLSSLIRPQLLGGALRSSAVIVTSRSISSGKLHPLVTSRIEIVGFTPSELTQYFTECLSGDSQAVETLLERVEENPVVASSCYLPLNAAIIAHLFLSGNQTLPTTTHGIFTALVLCCLSRYQRERLGIEDEAAIVDSLDSLPESLQEPFKRVCSLAFLGVVEDRVTFTSSDLEGLGIHSGVTTLDLLQAVPSMISQKTSLYYNFLHLLVQELLAAYHIASLSGSNQISYFEKLFEQPRFAAVFQFYAGITTFKSERKYLSKVAFLFPTWLIGPTGIRDIITNMVRRKDKQLLLSLIHCLYEADDPSLCHFVALQLDQNPEGERCLYLSRITLFPLDCLAVGYFLSCVNATYSGKFFADLKLCSIGDQGCRFLCRGLSRSPVSKSTTAGELITHLRSNNIGDEGAQHIAEVLRNSNIVQGLYMYGNPIGESGLKSIAEALTTNSSVIVLSIGHDELKITADSGPVLQEMLQRNSTLKYLEFYFNNQESDSGAMFIAEGLKQNSFLKTLDLSSNDEGVARLGDALLTNNSLEDLVLCWGTRRILSEKGLSVLVECLKINRGLVELKLPLYLEYTGVQETINVGRDRKIKVKFL